MEGVVTIICWDGIAVAMGGVTIDLGRISMVRQDANVREQSHEGQHEHNGSKFSPPQHHPAESIRRRRWLSNCVGPHVRARRYASSAPSPYLVISPPLLFGQHQPGLEMRQEVDETHVRPRAFDVSDRASD